MNAPVNLPEGMRPAHGLYDPRNEHDACGIGLYANINNIKSHQVVSKGLESCTTWSIAVLWVLTPRLAMALAF
jgi:hypothetical protein